MHQQARRGRPYPQPHRAVVPYYPADPSSAADEMAREEKQADRDDAQRLRDSGRLGATRDPDNQHERLGGEPRLDVGSVWLPAWMLLAYGGQKRWEREATYDELYRWSRKKWDGQT